MLFVYAITIQHRKNVNSAAVVMFPSQTFALRAHASIVEDQMSKCDKLYLKYSFRQKLNENCLRQTAETDIDR